MGLLFSPDCHDTDRLRRTRAQHPARSQPLRVVRHPLAVAGLVRLCAAGPRAAMAGGVRRSEEHTSELQSLMRISYAVFCLKTKTNLTTPNNSTYHSQPDST